MLSQWDGPPQCAGVGASVTRDSPTEGGKELQKHTALGGEGKKGSPSHRWGLRERGTKKSLAALESKKYEKTLS